MEDRDAEHKYVEYCLQLRGYGEEQLRARNADEEDCHIASSCYGIIIVNNNEKLHSSYKWDRVLTIAGKVSWTRIFRYIYNILITFLVLNIDSENSQR